MPVITDRDGTMAFLVIRFTRWAVGRTFDDALRDCGKEGRKKEHTIVYVFPNVPADVLHKIRVTEYGGTEWPAGLQDPIRFETHL